MLFAARNRQNGQSIIETVVGIIFLVPIVLFLFDIGVLVLANTANDALAKQAARAAAGALSPAPVAGPNQPPPDPPGSPGYWANAQAAAQAVVARYQKNKSGYMQGVTLRYLGYNDHSISTNTGGLHQLGAPPNGVPADPGNGNCIAIIDMQVGAPVPFPGFNPERTFTATSMEPITAVPP